MPFKQERDGFGHLLDREQWRDVTTNETVQSRADLWDGYNESWHQEMEKAKQLGGGSLM